MLVTYVINHKSVRNILPTCSMPCILSSTYSCGPLDIDRALLEEVRDTVSTSFSGTAKLLLVSRLIRPYDELRSGK